MSSDDNGENIQPLSIKLLSQLQNFQDSVNFTIVYTELNYCTHKCILGILYKLSCNYRGFLFSLRNFFLRAYFTSFS